MFAGLRHVNDEHVLQVADEVLVWAEVPAGLMLCGLCLNPREKLHTQQLKQLCNVELSKTSLLTFVQVWSAATACAC